MTVRDGTRKCQSVSGLDTPVACIALARRGRNQIVLVLELVLDLDGYVPHRKKTRIVLQLRGLLHFGASKIEDEDEFEDDCESDPI